MIVITDGESHDSPDLEKVIQQSERDNVTRYAVAVSSVLPALPPPRPPPQAASSLIDLYHQTPGGLQGGFWTVNKPLAPQMGLSLPYLLKSKMRISCLHCPGLSTIGLGFSPHFYSGSETSEN